MKKTIFCLWILPILLNALNAAETTEMPPPPPQGSHEREMLPPPPPPRHHSPEKFRRGQGIWRAFSQLSDEEKKELLELQRKSPDQFRAVMQEKADRLYEKERLRKEEMAQIAKQYKESTDAQEKENLKAKLQKMVREDFDLRAKNARRNLEEGKRRLKRMEEELAKREANSDAIVSAVTEELLK